jgi:crotonobetainyl-CoA:carnitine CoA-transferase CaiB-like acyl-CoA transferase
VPIALPIVEFMTGVCAAAAVVAALREAHRGGSGQLIDMALYDCAFTSMATFLPRPLAGSSEPVRRAGNRHAMIAPWNVYQARDGWLLVCVGSDAQWQRLCDIMERPDLRRAGRFERTPGRLAHATEVDGLVRAWTARHTIETCVAALNAAQIACGPIVRIDGHPREANLGHRGMLCRLRDPLSGRDVDMPGSPLRMSASSGRAPERIPAPNADREAIRRLASAERSQRGGRSTRSGGPDSPLSGTRIVEIGHYTTVPLCTRILASLGAEVIKVEPPEGEATRDWPPTQRGQGYFFTYTNSDKKSLVLDLRRDVDAADLRALVRGADVLIENLKPGALARRGFSAAELAMLNPALIYCSISGFGVESLYAGRPAYDSVVQAMSGIMDVVRSEGVPVKTGISSADLLGAEMGVLAVLAALAYRDRTGAGQVIDLSMQDIAAWLTQTVWDAAVPASPPVRAMACRDGYVVGTSETEASAQELQQLTRNLERNEAVARLARLGVQTTPVSTVHEMLAHPQTAARGLWFLASEEGMTWPLLASPLRLSRPPPAVRRPMPTLGRDSAEILASLRPRDASR